MAYKVYKNDIYPFCLVLGKMDDIDEVNKEYESPDREYLVSNQNAEAVTYPILRKGTNYSAVCVLFNVQPTVRLIAHESFHVTYMVMNILCHVELNDYTDECYAYLIGWVSDKIDEYQKCLKD